jgi:hypothetical protein
VGKVPRRHQAGSQEVMAAQVGIEMEVIFGGAGSRVVMKECSDTYGVTPLDAVERPEAFRFALFSLVGELGTTMVMGRINKRVWGASSSPKSRALSSADYGSGSSSVS